MKKQKPRDVPVIIMPKGYGIEDLLDMDDSDFDGEEPIMEEEVVLRFERDNEK